MLEDIRDHPAVLGNLDQRSPLASHAGASLINVRHAVMDQIGLSVRVDQVATIKRAWS